MADVFPGVTVGPTKVSPTKEGAMLTVGPSSVIGATPVGMLLGETVFAVEEFNPFGGDDGLPSVDVGPPGDEVAVGVVRAMVGAVDGLPVLAAGPSVVRPPLVGVLLGVPGVTV
jgi:hypothetical protein